MPGCAVVNVLLRMTTGLSARRRVHGRKMHAKVACPRTLLRNGCQIARGNDRKNASAYDLFNDGLLSYSFSRERANASIVREAARTACHGAGRPHMGISSASDAACQELSSHRA